MTGARIYLFVFAACLAKAHGQDDGSMLFDDDDYNGELSRWRRSYWTDDYPYDNYSDRERDYEDDYEEDEYDRDRRDTSSYFLPTNTGLTMNKDAPAIRKTDIKDALTRSDMSVIKPILNNHMASVVQPQAPLAAFNGAPVPQMSRVENPLARSTPAKPPVAKPQTVQQAQVRQTVPQEAGKKVENGLLKLNVVNTPATKRDGLDALKKEIPASLMHLDPNLDKKNGIPNKVVKKAMIPQEPEMNQIAAIENWLNNPQLHSELAHTNQKKDQINAHAQKVDAMMSTDRPSFNQQMDTLLKDVGPVVLKKSTIEPINDEDTPNDVTGEKRTIKLSNKKSPSNKQGARRGAPSVAPIVGSTDLEQLQQQWGRKPYSDPCFSCTSRELCGTTSCVRCNRCAPQPFGAHVTETSSVSQGVTKRNEVARNPITPDHPCQFCDLNCNHPGCRSCDICRHDKLNVAYPVHRRQFVPAPTFKIPKQPDYCVKCIQPSQCGRPECHRCIRCVTRDSFKMAHPSIDPDDILGTKQYYNEQMALHQKSPYAMQENAKRRQMPQSPFVQDQIVGPNTFRRQSFQQPSYAGVGHDAFATMENQMKLSGMIFRRTKPATPPPAARSDDDDEDDDDDDDDNNDGDRNEGDKNDSDDEEDDNKE